MPVFSREDMMATRIWGDGVRLHKAINHGFPLLQLGTDLSVQFAGLFASKSDRRTAAPTLECVPPVGAGLLAKNGNVVHQVVAGCYPRHRIRTTLNTPARPLPEESSPWLRKKF
ncbi:hypothetical protein D3C86_1955700 [compost metagenome]